MNWLRKIISGNEYQRTRFHDQKGHLLDLAGFRYLPHSISSTAMRLLFKYRPARPWLGYRAVRQITTLIRPDWKVLEFGSGMSTLWFAQRCRLVVSVEKDPDWFNEVRRMIERRGLSSVEYHWADEQHYHTVAETKFPDGHFDFALVDGYNRAACMRSAIKKVRAGGWVYLDNSDCVEGEPHGTRDIEVAERILLEHLGCSGSTPVYFRDLLPTYLTVTEGMLGRL